MRTLYHVVLRAGPGPSPAISQPVVVSMSPRPGPVAMLFRVGSRPGTASDIEKTPRPSEPRLAGQGVHVCGSRPTPGCDAPRRAASGSPRPVPRVDRIISPSAGVVKELGSRPYNPFPADSPVPGISGGGDETSGWSGRPCPSRGLFPTFWWRLLSILADSCYNRRS